MYKPIMPVSPLNLDLQYYGLVTIQARWSGVRLADATTRLWLPLNKGGFIEEHGALSPLRPGHWYLLPAGTRRRHVCRKSFRMAFAHAQIADQHGLDLHHGHHLRNSWTTGPEIEQAFIAWCKQAPPDFIPNPTQHESSGTAISSAAATCFNDGMLRCAVAPAICGPKSDDPLLPVLAYAQTHLNQPLTAADLAAVSGWAQAQFNRRFRASYGMAPMTWLRHRRLLAAHHFLRTEPERTLASIAAACGFHDAFHLSKCFKKHHGISPKVFRRQSQNFLP